MDPHGNDEGGGFDKGQANAKARQEGGMGSANHDDRDDQARQNDVKRTNAWIKGGEKI